MEAGISFIFYSHVSDLYLPQGLMDDLLPKKAAEGSIKLLFGEKSLGVAGKLTPDQLKDIPKGSKLSMVTDVEGADEYADFVAGVQQMNVALRSNKFSKENFFEIYEPGQAPA